MTDTARLAADLAGIVGANHVVTDPDITAPYLAEPRDLYRGTAACVVRPGSTAEVAAILRHASAHRIPVVPQGGNTGLVGGQIPDQSGAEILLSLRRLDHVREVDAATNTMTLEAGVTLERAQGAADTVDRLFPLALASQGSCTIGGNLSTNAGGTAVLAYGNARELALGLEVVLADGRVLNSLGKLRKDNTGYDLRDLFIGAEGTLGIITAAVLKLFPRPRSVATAFCGVADPDAGLHLLTLAQSLAGTAVTTFELVPRFGIEVVLRHGHNVRDPLSDAHPWYVLIELSGQQADTAEPMLEQVLGSAIERELVADAVIATSLAQREDLWRLREQMSDVQRKEGGSIKHDVAIPVAKVPAFIEAANALVLSIMPGARLLPFGHLGDGNIHYNVSQPLGMDKQTFLDRWYEITDPVHGLVVSFGGSVSAEHGIGVMKRELLTRVKDPVALAVMRDLKKTLDPLGILNPGKVL